MSLKTAGIAKRPPISETLRTAASGPDSKAPCPGLALGESNRPGHRYLRMRTASLKQQRRQVSHGDTLAGAGDVKPPLTKPRLGGDSYVSVLSSHLVELPGLMTNVELGWGRHTRCFRDRVYWPRGRSSMGCGKWREDELLRAGY